jgi:hypothetical protein
MNGGPSVSSHEADRLIYAGLLGLAAAAVLQLLEKDEPSLAKLVGIYAFAIAIPLLTAGLIADYARQANRDVSPVYTLLGGLGMLSAVLGFGALFFHYGPGPGATFAVAAAVSLVFIRRL